MVNYIKKDQPFFPTDHCGVLRVDEKTLNPHFIMYMLEIAAVEPASADHIGHP